MTVDGLGNVGTKLDKTSKVVQHKETNTTSSGVHKISAFGDNSGTKKSTQNSKSNVEKSSNSGIIEFEKGVTKDVKEIFNTEYENMRKKFGNISTISSVGILRDNDTKTYGTFYDNSGVLELKFANKKNFVSEHTKMAKEMNKSGGWSTAHYLHALRHEIGHAIQLEHKLNDPLWDNKIEQISAIMSSLPEYNNIEFRDDYSVSMYAMENLDEFISECIAKSMMKKSGEIVNKVIKIIKGVE